MGCVVEEYRWKAVRASRRIGFEFLEIFGDNLRANSDITNLITLIFSTDGKSRLRTIIGSENRFEISILKCSFFVVGGNYFGAILKGWNAGALTNFIVSELVKSAQIIIIVQL